MRYYRKIIKIRAEDSPNVRLALIQQRAGQEPTGEILCPGVLTWDEYQNRRATWDKVRQSIGLDAEFYEGTELMLFPSPWMDEAEERAKQLKGTPRKAKAIGIDPAEGGDKTAMAVVDELGLIELISEKTPDTSYITGAVVNLGHKHNVPPESWIFDRGGGGKEHADRLRAQGRNVRTVAFGESLTADLNPGRLRNSLRTRIDNREDRYAYKNRRAEMYGELSLLLDPSLTDRPRFAIPSEYPEIRYQLSFFPRKYDIEGRLELPPKNKRGKDSKEKCLVELIGHSPDEADALVLAVHGLLNKKAPVMVGAAW